MKLLIGMKFVYKPLQFIQVQFFIFFVPFLKKNRAAFEKHVHGVKSPRCLCVDKVAMMIQNHPFIASCVHTEVVALSMVSCSFIYKNNNNNNMFSWSSRWQWRTCTCTCLGCCVSIRKHSSKVKGERRRRRSFLLFYWIFIFIS